MEASDLTLANPLKRFQSFKIIILNQLYKKDNHVSKTGDFLNKIKNIIAIPENTILVTTDLAGPYPSIPHETGLKALDKTKTKYLQLN